MPAEAAEAVRVMDLSCRQAQDGILHAEQAGTTFASIAQAVTAITAMNHQIATAAEEQSTVAEEINRNVTEVARIAEQTAAGARQTSVASGQLARLAGDSQTQIARFLL